MTKHAEANFFRSQKTQKNGDEKMKINYRTAFNKLKKIGCPVIEGGYDGEDTFRISAEDNEKECWADYYQMTDGDKSGFMMGVNNKINDILSEQGLFAEWCHPGVLSVWEE
jgi:hypothetical protein|tara:strand:- start:46 stop:378 length:333 start_codon:yes stop_codon:yes gene_type:complete